MEMKFEEVINNLKENIEDYSVERVVNDIFGNNMEGNCYWSLGKNFTRDLIKLIVNTTENIDDIISLNNLIELVKNENRINDMLKNSNMPFDKLKQILSLNEEVRQELYKYIIDMINRHIKLFPEPVKKEVKADLDNLYDEDIIIANIFGKNKEVVVYSVGYNKNQYDENGNFKYRGFKLSKEEIKLLKDFLKNINIEDYKQQILDYCNEQYSGWSDIKITLDEVSKEVDIFGIGIKVEKDELDNENITYPEIAFWGECGCDEEHGICIGFRDGKFFGILSLDWMY